MTRTEKRPTEINQKRRATPSWLRASPTLLLLTLGTLLSVTTASELRLTQEKKLTMEELLSGHLASIGTVENRSKTSRVVSGTSNLVIRIGGAANLEGKSMMVSTGPKFRFGLQFSTQEYTGEDMATDGSRTTTGMLPQGRRSGLSAFLNSQQLPLKEGLLGGVLSTAWPLLRVSELQPKLEYRGLKKLDNKQLHEVGYRAAKGGGDLKVQLYFEPGSLRHVVSKYSFEVGASIGTRETSNLNPETYYTLTETFDDFRAVDGLTLPHKYRLQYSAQGGVASTLYDWSVVVSSITHGQQLDNQLFTIR